MLAYVIRRLGYGFATVLGVLLLLFALFFLYAEPEEIARRAIGEKAPAEASEKAMPAQDDPAQGVGEVEPEPKWNGTPYEPVKLTLTGTGTSRSIHVEVVAIEGRIRPRGASPISTERWVITGPVQGDSQGVAGGDVTGGDLRE